jgi:hypothetical protein
MENYLAIKKSEELIYPTVWMNLKSIMLIMYGSIYMNYPE